MSRRTATRRVIETAMPPAPTWDDLVEALAPEIWLKFDEADGSLINHGSWNDPDTGIESLGQSGDGSEMTYEQEGAFAVDEAILFSGTESYFRAATDPNNYSATGGTVAFLVKFSITTPVWFGGWSQGSDVQACSFRTQSSGRFQIFLSSNGTNDSAITSQVSIADDAWHLVILDFTGSSTPLMYLDGALVSTDTLTNVTPLSYWLNDFNPDEFTMGVRPGLNDTADYNGLMDEFFYLDGDHLTTQQIADLATAAGV